MSDDMRSAITRANAEDGERPAAPEICESCVNADMPDTLAVAHDADGVPLCEVCLNGLVADSAKVHEDDFIAGMITADLEAFMRDEPSHAGEVIGKMYAELRRPIPGSWNVGGKASEDQSIESRRAAYADHLVACADTVAILRPDEMRELHSRAQSGEFDADLDWRSPYLNARKSGVKI